MEKIIINPHNCSREEYGELKKYLNEQSWDWDTESKTSKQEVQLPNKVFALDFLTNNYVKARNIIIIAADSEETVTAYLYKRYSVKLTKMTWLMNSWHETIYVRNGSKPEEVQAKILYNTNFTI